MLCRCRELSRPAGRIKTIGLATVFRPIETGRDRSTLPRRPSRVKGILDAARPGAPGPIAQRSSSLARCVVSRTARGSVGVPAREAPRLAILMPNRP